MLSDHRANRSSAKGQRLGRPGRRPIQRSAVFHAFQAEDSLSLPMPCGRLASKKSAPTSGFILMGQKSGLILHIPQQETRANLIITQRRLLKPHFGAKMSLTTTRNGTILAREKSTTLTMRDTLAETKGKLILSDTNSPRCRPSVRTFLGGQPEPRLPWPFDAWTCWPLNLLIRSYRRCPVRGRTVQPSACADSSPGQA